jgi:hypothetical protein
LKRRLTVFVAELKRRPRNRPFSNSLAAMGTRINQSACYVLEPAFIAAKNLASIGEGDAAFLALLFVFPSNCDSALHQVGFSATPASFAALMKFRCRYNRSATSTNPFSGPVASSAPAWPF